MEKILDNQPDVPRNNRRNKKKIIKKENKIYLKEIFFFVLFLIVGIYLLAVVGDMFCNGISFTDSHKLFIKHLKRFF